MIVFSSICQLRRLLIKDLQILVTWKLCKSRFWSSIDLLEKIWKAYRVRRAYG